MAPKQKSKGGDDVLKQIDIFQAVVIADTFNIRFGPLTQNEPSCLIPVVNTPLLDFTLECLENAGLQEVYIYCKHFSDKIREHVKKSRWNEDSEMKTSVISSQDALSLGDALRDLDAKNFIKNDFLLVHGDLVSNLSLLSLLSIHRENRRLDKGAVMTMVYRKVSPHQKTRSCEEELVVVSQSSNNKILHHQRTGNLRKVSVPLEVFQNSKSVEVHYNLHDTHISICSPEILPIFSDNFDYQTQDDIVKGILVHQEIMGNSLYLHLVEEKYAARVCNFSLYNSVSFDIIHRWVYPTVPEVSLNTNTKRYTYSRGNIYRHRNVTLSRNSRLVRDVVVGEGCEVGSLTSICNSVLGKYCNIGAHVELDHAFLWDGVVVGDNSIVKYCILANNVTIGKNCHLGRGCVIGQGVKVGDNVVLKENTQLTLVSGIQQEKFSDNVDGYLYLEEDDSGSELNWSASDPWELLYASDEESEEEEEDPEGAQSEVSLGRDSPGDSLLKSFYREVFDSILRIKVEGIKADNIILEINCSKHANNISSCEVVVQVVQAMLSIPLHMDPSIACDKYIVQLVKLLDVYKELYTYYVHNIETEKFALQANLEFVTSNPSFEKILAKLLHTLYEKDFLREESILLWYDECVDIQGDNSRGDMKCLVTQCKPFIEWLRNAEEESSDEE